MFITWRLHGSTPAKSSLIASDGKKFRDYDQVLIATATGPRWLEDERVAGVVAAALKVCDDGLKLYRLRAWVLLINHVHILIEPNAPLAAITRRVKGFTARKANSILHRQGKQFWQTESYDHWIRNEKEANQVIRYIENNPVAAGLVDKPEDWIWSSAWSAK